MVKPIKAMPESNVKKQRIIIFSLSLGLLVLALFFSMPAKEVFFSTDIQETKVKKPKTEEDEIKNLLVLGSDSVIPKNLKDWRGRSDVIALVSINQSQEKVSIINIPRDTKVDFKKFDADKINAANAIGGYKFARRAINKLLGIKIDNVVVFSMQGFSSLIDSVGDIEISVPKQLSYEDKTAGLVIDIKPGLQKMDGKTLISYLRFRNDQMGDIGRIKRQQKFIKAALRKLTETETLFKMPEIMQKVNEVFITDMNFKDMFSLGIFLKSLPKESFKTFLLPGDFGTEKYSGYWLANEAKINDLKLKVFGKAYIAKLEAQKKEKEEEKAKKKDEEESAEKTMDASEFSFETPESLPEIFNKGAGLA